MTCKSPRDHTRLAFTLLELMLVLVILVLLASLVAPAMRGIGRDLLSEAPRHELVRILRQARWWAITNGYPCQVRLQYGQDPCVLQVTYSSDTAPAQPVREDWANASELPQIASVLQSPTDDSVQPEENLAITFTPTGVDRDTVIELADEDGNVDARIEIRKPTGLIWLTNPDSNDSITKEEIARINTYWTANCSKLPQQ